MDENMMLVEVTHCCGHKQHYWVDVDGDPSVDIAEWEMSICDECYTQYEESQNPEW